MKTEEEILKELEHRFEYFKKQNISYSSYRANKNFMRGLLFCLGLLNKNNQIKEDEVKTYLKLKRLKGLK
jgi:hypothetical protein